MPEATLIIYRSPDGEKDWEPVKTEDVPEWLKKPEVMGRLVTGEMAQGPVNVVLPYEMRPWYRASVVPTLH